MVSFSSRLEAEQLSFPLLAIQEGMGYKQLFDITRKVGIDCGGVIRDFVEIVQGSSPNRMVGYETVPEYGESTSNYRFRYLIVKIPDGDLVMCLFKIVDMSRVRGRDSYFTAWRPISANQSPKNEIEVLKRLSMTSCVPFAITFDGRSDSYDVDNYYNDRESAKSILCSKWRSKHGVNKYSDMFKSEIYDTLTTDTRNLKDQVLRLNREWEKKKKIKSDNRSDLRLLSLMEGSDNIQVFCTFFGDILVAFSFAVKLPGNYIGLLSSKYVSVLSEDEIVDYCGCSLKDARIIRKHLGYITQYRVHDYFLKDFRAISYYGDIKNRKMAEYKQSVFKKCIYYRRTPIVQAIRVFEEDDVCHGKA